MSTVIAWTTDIWIWSIPLSSCFDFNLSSWNEGCFLVFGFQRRQSTLSGDCAKTPKPGNCAVFSPSDLLYSLQCLRYPLLLSPLPLALVPFHLGFRVMLLPSAHSSSSLLPTCGVARNSIRTACVSWSTCFCTSVICQTTGPQPLPKPFLHLMRSRASSFKWEYPLLSSRSSSNFLRLLPRLLVTSIFPCIFPSIICFRRQFLHKIWPIQLAFCFLISCRILLCSQTLSNTSSCLPLVVTACMTFCTLRNSNSWLLRCHHARIC